MVNATKVQIHQTLQNSRDWISGEDLSRLLGISRVAVWKHLQKMKDGGYPLESDHRGYRLDPREDTLSPWAMEPYGDRIFHYPELPSTMDRARELAESGAPGGILVLAEEQTRGRGRMDRVWDSRYGGIYCTLITRPVLTLEEVGPFSRLVLDCLKETLVEDYGIPAEFRAPNDLLTSRGKIAGLLAEVSGEPDRVRYLNLGFGVNIRNHPRVPGRETVSLEELTGEPCLRRDFLFRLLPRLDRLPGISGGPEENSDTGSSAVPINRPHRKKETRK